MHDIYEEIAKRIDQMSKVQKQIAYYILEHPNEIAFMTIKELSQEAKVSEASVIRFGNFLGYSGYSALQQLFRQSTRKSLTTRERLALSCDVYEEQYVGEVFEQDRRRIQTTLEQLNTKDFFDVVEAIGQAERIYIICGRSARSLGIFFEYYLNIVRNKVYLITNFESSETHFSCMNERDLAIGITFERYTKQTIELVTYAKGKGVPVVALTDRMTSPIIKLADYYLLSETSMATYIDSFVAPLTMINALLTYVGKNHNEVIEERLGELEEVWQELDIFV